MFFVSDGPVKSYNFTRVSVSNYVYLLDLKQILLGKSS